MSHTVESHRWALDLYSAKQAGFLATLLLPAELRDQSGLLAGAVNTLADINFVHLAGVFDCGPDMTAAFARDCTATYLYEWRR